MPHTCDNIAGGFPEWPKAQTELLGYIKTSICRNGFCGPKIYKMTSAVPEHTNLSYSSFYFYLFNKKLKFFYK